MSNKNKSRNKEIENFRLEQMEIAKELCPEDVCDMKSSDHKTKVKIKSKNTKRD